MRKLRTGIIGSGKVARCHARAFNSSDRAELVAVSNHNLPRAEKMADEFGIRAYDNITNMIKAEQLDAVSICTPHLNHMDATLEAARSGCHVLIEKPLAIQPDACRAIIEAGDENRVKIAVVGQRRFYAPVMRMHRAIQDGKIGEPVVGVLILAGWRDEAYYKSDPWRGSWAGEGGGVLVNQAPHQIDILLWMMGSEMETVYGVASNFNHPYIEVEDTAVATIKFKNGALASVVLSNSQNPALFGKVHVFGKNGAAVGVQTDGGSMFIAGVSSDIQEAPFNDIWTVPGEANMLDTWKEQDARDFYSSDPIDRFFLDQINDFLDAIIDDRDPMITARFGKRTVDFFDAVYRSTKTGEAVHLTD